MIKKKVFTLIELIVVIAIIAVLAAVIAPQALKAIEKAKVAKVVVNVKAIANAAKMLYVDTSHWATPGDVGSTYWLPIENSSLMINPLGLPGWDGPYLDRTPGPNPWKGSYYLSAMVKFTGDDWYEYHVHLCENCYDNPGSKACKMPDNVIIAIDEAIDDGDTSKGNFRKQWAGEGEWVIEQDVCETKGCN